MHGGIGWRQFRSSSCRAATARPSAATRGGSSRWWSSWCSAASSSTPRGRRFRTRTTPSGRISRRSTRRCSAAKSPHAWFGPKPAWWPALLPFSPALLILPFPGLFRFTCYYYRGAYYKAFWSDPSSCAVGEPRGTSYWGERWFPLMLQNVHRYFVYVAVLFLVRPVLRRLAGAVVPRPRDGGKEFGIGVGTLVLAVNVVLLSQLHARLPLAAAPRRRPQGRDLEVAGCSQACYNCSSALNYKHQLFAWCSLFSVAFADVYVRLCSMGDPAPTRGSSDGRRTRPTPTTC